MAHFAEILNGVVQRVIVVHDNDEANGAQFCHDLFGGECRTAIIRVVDS
jgi:hypothetical protein